MSGLDCETFMEIKLVRKMSPGKKKSPKKHTQCFFGLISKYSHNGSNTCTPCLKVAGITFGVQWSGVDL